MAIPNPDPVTIPSTLEKTYPDLWLTEVRIHAPTPTTGGISIHALPFNAATGEIAEAIPGKNIITNELWLAVQEIPELQQAMGAVFAAIPALQQWVAARELEQAAVDNIDPV